jgi:hypothetical protein
MPVQVPGAQQERCCWTGGQGTSPCEQNTQQSPGSGRSIAPQPLQGWKNTQASSGIASSMRAAQCGQVNVLWVTVVAIPAGCTIGRAQAQPGVHAPAGPRHQYISYSSWKRTVTSGAAWLTPPSTAAL